MGARVFLVSSRMRIAEQEWSELLEYQTRKKRSFQKWTEDWPQVFSSRSLGEFRFAANALLFWSAIFVIAKWLQLILFNLPKIAEYKDGINYYSSDSGMRTGNKKRAKKPFHIFPFQNGSKKTAQFFYL